MTCNQSFKRAWLIHFGEVPLYVFVLTAGVVAQFMSGVSGGFGLPISPDRLMIPLGLMMWWLHPERRTWTWRPRFVHVLMLAATIWCLASIVFWGSYSSRETVFGFIDSYGVQPFLLFSVASVIWCSGRRRLVLALGLSILGAYLGYVALMQGLDLPALIFPDYIVKAGSNHYGRAFGPSLQVGSNGLQLFACMAAAVVAAANIRGRWRYGLWAVAAVCAAGLFFTMTRSVWIGGALGVIVALWLNPRTRRWVLVMVVALPVALSLVLAASAPLRSLVASRLNDSGSAYDRLSAADTALRMIPYRPVAGFGYYRFYLLENSWLFQNANRPIAATDIAVHNVFLGLAVELGIVGVSVWVLTLVRASMGLFRPRPSPSSEPAMWRQVAIGYLVCWSVQALLMPITYALPSSLLWLLLGITNRPVDVGFVRVPERGRRFAQRWEYQ